MYSNYTLKSAWKLELDIRERSGGVAEPWDPGEAGGTGPVASCSRAGFVLASVSALSPQPRCWAVLIFPPVSCSSHGLVHPPPRPHPEPGSAFASTQRFCARVYVHASLPQGRSWSQEDSEQTPISRLMPCTMKCKVHHLCAVGSVYWLTFHSLSVATVEWQMF